MIYNFVMSWQRKSGNTCDLPFLLDRDPLSNVLYRSKPGDIQYFIIVFFFKKDKIIAFC